MQSALGLYASPSVTWVNQLKTVEFRIMQFSPQNSPIVFAGKVSARNYDGFHLSGGVKQGWGGENKLFSRFMRQYLENCTTYM